MISNRIFVILICIASNIPTALLNLKANEKYESLDRVVAIVEKSVVTQKELEKEINNIIEKIKIAKQPMPNQDILVKEVLGRLIEKKLIMQYAELIGIKIEREYLESVVGNIASKNNMTTDEMRIKLKDDGVDFNEFKEGISYELLLNQVKDREITSKINISDFEIENALKKIESLAPPEFKISHILLKKGSDYEVGGEKLKVLLNKLKTESFSNLAINYSQGPMAKEGGVLGWKKIEELPKIFSEEVIKMNVGDISKPLISGNGIHILRLDEAKNSSKTNKIMSEQFKISQVLIKVNEINNEDDIKRKMENIKNQIIGGLEFANAASKFSEDPSSFKGGSLGWVDKSVMLPEYKSAVESSELGKVSGPFSTEIGWVLLFVTEKRNKDITDKQNKLSAKVQLLKRKTQIKYKDWLESIKAQVHIEVLLNN